MKAKIFEIKRFAVHDGDGIRTTVFFKGCSLKCVWCHNPEGLSMQSELAYFQHKCISCGECVSVCPVGAQAMKNDVHIFHREKCISCGKCAEACLGNALTFYGQDISVNELLAVLLRDKDFYDNSNGGVTLSGGECLLYADFCQELLKQLKERDIHTAVDTCGFVSQAAFDKVIPYTDIFLYDIKAITEILHQEGTGHSNQSIIENLLYLDERGCKTEIRIPYIPQYNDTEIEKIGSLLSGLKHLTKVRVLAYHNCAGSKYESLNRDNTLPKIIPTELEVENAKRILRSFNLQVL